MSLLTVVLFALLGIEQIEIVDRVFLQLSILPCTSCHRKDRDSRQSLLTVVLFIFLSIGIDRDSRQSLLTVVLFILLGIEQIEIVDRVFLQLSYLYFLASNRQRQQIESSYSCPICTSCHRIDERQQIESSYSCPFYISQLRIDRDRRQSLLTVVLFALLGIEQIEIVDRVFLTVVLFILLSIEQIEIVDRVFLQLSYLHFLASNRQRQQIESSYSCPIYTSWHRIDRRSQIESLTVVLFALLGIEQIEIVDRVFLQLSYLHFLASNRQKQQIESSYSCPICTSWHRIDRNSRQSLLTVVLFMLLSIEQIEIVNRVFLQCPIYTSQHRIDRDRRQSLLTVVLFRLLSIDR